MICKLSGEKTSDAYFRVLPIFETVFPSNRYNLRLKIDLRGEKIKTLDNFIIDFRLVNISGTQSETLAFSYELLYEANCDKHNLADEKIKVRLC